METLEAQIARTMVIEIGSDSVGFRVPSSDKQNNKAVFGSCRIYPNSVDALVMTDEDDGEGVNLNSIDAPFYFKGDCRVIDYDALRLKLAAYISQTHMYVEAIVGVQESEDQFVGPYEFDFR